MQKNYNNVFLVCLSILVFFNNKNVVGFGDPETKYIDTEDIISRMPELENIQKRINDYARGLESELKERQKNVEEKYNKFNSEKSKLTSDEIQVREQSLRQAMAELQNYQMTARNDVINKQKELMEPLYEKVKSEVKKKYTGSCNAVVDKNNGDIWVLNEKVEVTQDILKSLGLQNKPRFNDNNKKNIKSSDESLSRQMDSKNDNNKKNIKSLDESLSRPMTR